MQFYMLRLGSKAGTEQYLPKESLEYAAAAEGAGLIRSTSAIISIRGTKAAKRALHRLGSERRLLGQTPYCLATNDVPAATLRRMPARRRLPLFVKGYRPAFLSLI